ncbi:MAG: tRNA uridine-5-carboxymethylaminomethyl(34) synthesis enzyme MnmG, partial [Turneriella sp.]|nr:tRNA uridine-5-carboxymethylaminomethyl(34) synthesis enzyme MnmG [Turneriella sp.]
FTSRAEHLLLLRKDNADFRLMHYAAELGVDNGLMAICREKYQRYERYKKAAAVSKCSAALEQKLESVGVSVTRGTPYVAILRRPQLSEEAIQAVFAELREIAALPEISVDEELRLAMEIKYEGYFEREAVRNERRLHAAERPIPDDFDYDSLDSIKFEARQKLKKIRPRTIGQAARISGVDPSDIDILLVALESRRRAKEMA